MTERHSLYPCPNTSARPGSQPGMREIPSVDETNMQQMVGFTQVHLLVQVLSQIWEKSHWQMSRTGSRWQCDCTGTSTRSSSQPRMGVPHRQMRRTSSRWSCTCAHLGSLARYGNIPSTIETDRQQKIISQAFGQNKFIKTTFSTFRDDGDSIDVQMKPKRRLLGFYQLGFPGEKYLSYCSVLCLSSSDPIDKCN